ncbi:MAG: hypothetical protein COV52_08000 [Gammaproteobacteria bacterium CG11_big_fil_rev_8_21_14_0_20_46_22]|nr:MAG: hypothetical protein COW05_04080 [Gammaproteobacteria bacterium CG12_big_fil_rev_8_21_14_0_65_46_12]PIR10697.1 MAG: hypothetical protein COV52_08000 [Gammaproteobacteria bacterium CG11_big_fil_rev_8_21_14_0_20_46_22]
MSSGIKHSFSILLLVSSSFSALAQSSLFHLRQAQELQFYDVRAVNPQTTDAICRENMDPVVFDPAKNRLTAAGVIKLKNIKLDQQAQPSGLITVNGTADEYIDGPKSSVFKTKMTFASVGFRGGQYFYGAYADSWCAGNYILTVKSP